MQHEDLYHLRLLSIFHYVVGGFAALIALFPVIHFTVGIGMIFSGLANLSENGSLVFVGFLFTTVAGTLILIGWAFALAVAIAGYMLSRQINYTYCLVVAGLECLFNPFGTVLGVFTIIVLSRESIKELFQQPSLAEAAPAPKPRRRTAK